MDAVPAVPETCPRCRAHFRRGAPHIVTYAGQVLGLVASQRSEPFRLAFRGAWDDARRQAFRSSARDFARLVVPGR